MRTAALILVFLILVAPAFAVEDEAVLITKHAKCFVHALPAWPAMGDPVERIVRPGHTLLYTSRESGKMTRLIDATGTVAVNTRRLSYLVTRLVGVASDAERLYVLLWFSGRIYDGPADDDALLEGGRYELRVFWLRDGRALASPPLEPAGLPDAAPKVSLGAGPLELMLGGVSCYGTTARYKDAALRGE